MDHVPPRMTVFSAKPLQLAGDPAITLAAVTRHLLPHLEQGRRIDAAVLRAAMEAGFCASDASGAWTWKLATDACEAATVLFLRKYGRAMLRKAGSPAAALPMFERIAGLLPTHTRRTEESETFQQFSTPIPLGLAALTAAGIAPGDLVLEPSAGTGLLAILAEIAGATLALNELEDNRADLLAELFPSASVTRFNAAQIDDHLDPGVLPGVVLMNPPFSALANVSGRSADATMSPPRSLAWPRAGASWRSPARASHRTHRRGVTRSSGCRDGGASCSRRQSTARSSPGTARASTRGSPSSTSTRPTIRPASRRRPARPPTSRR